MKSSRFTGLALVWALGTAMHAQTYKVMDYFNSQPSTPLAPGVIAQSRGGYLVTTASDQTTDGAGVAFRVTTWGAVTVLHQFKTGNGERYSPVGGLTLGRDGQFYGTTAGGGATNGFGGVVNAGGVFKMTPDGIITTLHEFDSNVDGIPYAPPVQSMYGDFYGTTYGNESFPGGNNEDQGTVYKIDSAGNYTPLHSFNVQDGSNPMGALVQSATNFWFYGTAMHGGANNVGTIFRINSGGNYEVLYNFDSSHGGYPVAMIQANDGNFYGVTYLGGAQNHGVVFKMTPSSQVTVLHTFTGGSDGSGPLGGFLQGSDGYLYGTTGEGGASGQGVLFRMTTSGTGFAVLHDFHAASGETPVTLMQHTNGFFYGATNAGGVVNGVNYQGVFFRLDMGLPPFVTYLNTYGRVGMTVQLLGDGFTTDSQVFFNGVAATEVSDVENTFMKVVIPAGATTGPITVTTTKGTLTSNKTFVVRP
jgi:uncharacterized repeat protein (TIGR03803 family)